MTPLPLPLQLQTTLLEDGTLTLEHLPFRAGQIVQVSVRALTDPATGENSYPLRGLPVTYRDPFEGVAEGDWELLR